MTDLFCFGWTWLFNWVWCTQMCNMFFVYFREVPVGAGGGAVRRPHGQDPADSCLCLLCKYDQFIKRPLSFILFILKWVFETQIGHRLGNCNSVDCSISCRQLYTPVRTSLSLVSGPFSCGNMWIAGFSIQWWYGFSEANRQSTAENKTINQSCLCCSASICDPGCSPRVVKVEEGWSGGILTA